MLAAVSMAESVVVESFTLFIAMLSVLRKIVSSGEAREIVSGTDINWFMADKVAFP